MDLNQNFTDIQAGSKININLNKVPSLHIYDALPYIFGMAGIILLLNIITSGFKLMTSQGDPKAIAGAQAKLTTSATGILILFLAYWITKLIMQFLGINFTNILF
jgi:hypothetical protein